MCTKPIGHSLSIDEERRKGREEKSAVTAKCVLPLLI